MKISYEFEGYDLTEWAEFGGLPITLFDEDTDELGPDNLIAHDGDRWYLSGEGIICKHIGLKIKIRDSKLEDVIDQKPEWATHFSINGMGGGRFEEIIPNNVLGRYKKIKGHLFDIKDYPNRVEL